MRLLAAAALATALAGCAGRPARLVVVPSADRLAWAGELGRADAVSDPVLVNCVQDAASASGARALDVVVLAQGRRHIPAVTLSAPDPAAYMKNHLRGFLQRIGYLEPARWRS